jgi:tRNA pseudouridine(55) synthase
MHHTLPRHLVLEKTVGETPLSCAEAYRATHPELTGIPLAYAGRLDPMASGKLLILVGDECKRQTEYHNLDKAYEFSVLFGIESDTQDVLGRLSAGQYSTVNRTILTAVAESIQGDIELPYPHFSAKTVQGKPLHMWTLEGRLNEIEIPTKQSTVYELTLVHTEELSREQIANSARTKIDTIPPVTDMRKALGNDFRRVDVRADWERIKNDATLPKDFLIAHFRCTASSGTYMRSLAALIAKKCETRGLAWHIHRTNIGHYSTQTNQWTLEY